MLYWRNLKVMERNQLTLKVLSHPKVQTKVWTKVHFFETLSTFGLVSFGFTLKNFTCQTYVGSRVPMFEISSSHQTKVWLLGPDFGPGEEFFKLIKLMWKRPHLSLVKTIIWCHLCLLTPLIFFYDSPQVSRKMKVRLSQVNSENK